MRKRDSITAMFAANSLLFVPGSRPERFVKARGAGASLTVIDLEDAVAAGDKDEARKAALAEAERDPVGLAIRINGVATPAGIADLHALVQSSALPAALLLPMVDDGRDIEIVAAVLGDRCPDLIALIETPRGLRKALGIARVPGVVAVMFGGGDFAAELGVSLAWEPLLAARHLLLLACAEAGVPAIDVPYVRLDDAAGLDEECARSKSIGFAAKAAIHPSQVAAIEAAFAPTRVQINEAAEALRAYEAGGERAIRHNGRMLEAPLVKHYRAIVARHKESPDA